MTPEYVVLPFVIVRVLPAILTPPAPDNVLIDAPDVVELIFSVPVTATEDDAAIEPEPDKDSVPALIVVAPVYVLLLESVRTPEPSLLKPPAPLPMTPEMVVLPLPVTVKRLAPLVKLPLKVDALLVLALLMVAAPFMVMSLLEVKVPLPSINKVPALIATLLAAPKFASTSTLIAPPLILVTPVLVLVPDKVNVPVPTLVKATVDAEPFSITPA